MRLAFLLPRSAAAAERRRIPIPIDGSTAPRCSGRAAQRRRLAVLLVIDTLHSCATGAGATALLLPANAGTSIVMQALARCAATSATLEAIRDGPSVIFCLKTRTLTGLRPYIY